MDLSVVIYSQAIRAWASWTDPPLPQSSEMPSDHQQNQLNQQYLAEVDTININTNTNHSITSKF